MWVVYAIPLVAVVLVGAILYAEERYYTRHPEKTRPDVNPWP